MARQAAIISLHDDGSIALAWTAGGFHRESPFTVPSFMLERAAIDIAALVGITSRVLNMDSGYGVEVGVIGKGSVALLSPGWGGTYDNAVTTALRRFQPVRLSVPPQPSDIALLATARDIALDCVNQAGIANLTVLRPMPD